MTLEDKLDQTYQLRDRTVNDLKKKIAELEHLGYKKDTEEPANQRAQITELLLRVTSLTEQLKQSETKCAQNTAKHIQELKDNARAEANSTDYTRTQFEKEINSLRQTNS